MTNIADWNKAAAQLGFGIYWRGDDNHSGTVDIGEISDITGIYKDTAGHETSFFREAAGLVEQLISGTPPNPKTLTDSQRMLLQKEADLRTVAVHDHYLDARHYSSDERRMALHILRACRHLEDIYRWQVDRYNIMYEHHVFAKKDAVATRHFIANHSPHCLRIREAGCSALPEAPAIIPGAHLYTPGLTPETFRQLPEDLRSPYSALRYISDTRMPDAVPYIQDEDVRPFLKLAAKELREAARFARVDQKALKEERNGMAAFRTYLIEVAQAMESPSTDRPFHKAHEAWVKIPVTFRWALQFGPMEPIGGDPIRGHYGYQAYFGLTSTIEGSPMEVIERYGIQRMENELAALLGQLPRKIGDGAANRVRVIRPLMVAGNARPPFGSIGGFAAPNDESKRLSWVIQNENAEALRRMKASIAIHLGERYAHFLEQGLATFNTALHEQTHKLGIQRLTKIRQKTGEQTTALAALGEGTWLALEECKASLAPFWLAERLQQAHMISDEKRDGLVVAQMSWMFFWLNQSPGPLEHLNIYPAVATMMFGHFVKEGVLRWNAGKKLWDMTLDDVAEKSETLLKEVLHTQAAGNKAAAEALIARHVANPELGKMREEIAARSRAAGMPPPMTYVYTVGMDD